MTVAMENCVCMLFMMRDSFKGQITITFLFFWGTPTTTPSIGYSTRQQK
jgi:hypothetical protein